MQLLKLLKYYVLLHFISLLIHMNFHVPLQNLASSVTSSANSPFGYPQRSS